ncbi:NAD(P)H-dependent oxidoreductase [Nonomuraea jabiensis]|uniref:flavodoxin family protein n=1 Tax=Nonomuraea jabiensis TaxID=882448 RepID=UPI003437D416
MTVSVWVCAPITSNGEAPNHASRGHQLHPEALAEVVSAELRAREVDVDLIRAVDLDIRPGVQTDMGPGDDWPAVHDKLLRSEILVIATPTWVGHPPGRTTWTTRAATSGRTRPLARWRPTWSPTPTRRRPGP